jgi:hypothetical protein
LISIFLQVIPVILNGLVGGKPKEEGRRLKFVPGVGMPDVKT